MRLLNSTLGVIVAILVVLFAVSNRAEVEITLWPFPFQATLDVYAVALLAILIGFIGGMFVGWRAGSDARRDRRRLKVQVQDLEQALGRARMKADEG